MASISLLPSSLYPLTEAKDRPTAIASWEERQRKVSSFSASAFRQGEGPTALQPGGKYGYREGDDCADDGDLGALRGVRPVEVYLLHRAWV